MEEGSVDIANSWVLQTLGSIDLTAADLFSFDDFHCNQVFSDFQFLLTNQVLAWQVASALGKLPYGYFGGTRQSKERNL